MLDQIERLWARLTHTVGRSAVVLIDDTGPTQTAQLQFLGNISGQPVMLRDKVTLLHTFGISSVPPADSEAVTLSMNGDPASSVVVATGHRGSRPRNMKPGQSQIYDQSGSSVLLSNDHNAKIAATGTIAVTGGTIAITGSHDIKLIGTVDITGPVNITGAVHITGSLVLNGVTMVAP